MYNKSIISQAVRTPDITSDQIEAFIKLFKMVPVNNSARAWHSEIRAIDALEAGIVFIDEAGNPQDNIPSVLFNIASTYYGTSAKLFNQTFYKSFNTVAQASDYQLILDRCLHYFTTYGLESIGIKVPAYVPIQALDVPENKFNNNFKITIIQISSLKACVERLNEYLKNLVAPSSDLMPFITVLLPLVTISTDEIKSFEVQVIRHKMNNTVPTNPVNQLRYLIYATTGETLMIKNRYLRDRIKNAAKDYDTTAYNILSRCGLPALSSIFLRYKPIFLAFKSHYKCAPIINQLRRLADIYHAPLSNETLQNFIHLNNDGKSHVLKSASNRDLIKIVNSLGVRLSIKKDTAGVYPIRNGRIFVKDGALSRNQNKENDLYSLNQLLYELTRRLKPVLQDKVFYVPNHIDYAAPTSEKQMIGNIPFGSQIKSVPNEAFALGIHWFNQDEGSIRVDLDLHMHSATQHFGWNGDYRDKAVLYTGDQTDAPLPNGAAEAYWVNNQNDTYVINARLYSGKPEAEFKMFMTTVEPNSYSNRNSNYTFNPNTALFPPIPMKMAKGTESQNIGTFKDGKFFFYGGSLDSGIVPSRNYASFLEGITAQLDTKLSISDILRHCGAKIIRDVDSSNENLEDMISLAPEDLTVDTLFNIIDGNI